MSVTRHAKQAAGRQQEGRKEGRQEPAREDNQPNDTSVGGESGEEASDQLKIREHVVWLAIHTVIPEIEKESRTLHLLQDAVRLT